MTARMFGTNGVRGIINNDMTCDLALQMGKAIGTFFKGDVAVASDTRVSAPMLRSALYSGLMAVGCNIIDLGVIPTPAIQYYVKTHASVAGGVMITASHNPPEFNGIKCIDFDGTEMPREKEEVIEDFYSKSIECKEWNELGRISKYSNAGSDYVDAVLAKVDVDAIKAAKLTAVVDCANGAACSTAPLLMEKLGIRAITLNANEQGDFPGHPSEPTEENLKDLSCLVKSAGADFGVAHDGDADRAVFVTNTGAYVPGEKSLSLIAKTVISSLGGGKVVTPVSSSSMVEEVVKSVGGSLIYTAVGSPIVARRMIQENSPFGGEENGGLIFADHQYCRDGAMTIAKMAECIVRFGPLQDQIDQLPIYYVEKRKVVCPNNRKDDLINNIVEKYAEGNRIDRTDGLKILFDDGGWVLLRPSGTEPIFRIYSESKDKELSASRGIEFEQEVLSFLEGIGKA